MARLRRLIVALDEPSYLKLERLASAQERYPAQQANWALRQWIAEHSSDDGNDDLSARRQVAAVGS